MGKKETQLQLRDHLKWTDNIEVVLELLRKQAPFSFKQEKLCNNACIGRFLRAKDDNMKTDTKSLRVCLSWRDSIAIENLMTDEFSTEITEGIAYLADQDEESKPVLIHTILDAYSGGSCINHGKKRRIISTPF